MWRVGAEEEDSKEDRGPVCQYGANMYHMKRVLPHLLLYIDKGLKVDDGEEPNTNVKYVQCAEATDKGTAANGAPAQKGHSLHNKKGAFCLV